MEKNYVKKEIFFRYFFILIFLFLIFIIIKRVKNKIKFYLVVNDQEKIINLLKIIEYLLSKTYDDVMTKCMLISALTKLHSNINFSEQDFVNKIIEKYSRDENVEIQQRCLEYKRLLKTNTSILKNQFTTVLDELDIDSSLSFLDSYVQTKIQAGAREYDRRRYEQEKNIFGKEEKELVIAPYQAPEILDPNPSANQNKFTSLYEDKQNYQKKNISSELKASGTHVWTKAGYISEPKKATPSSTAFQPPMNGVSNTSIGTSPSTITTSGTGAFSNVSSGYTAPKNSKNQPETFKYVPKKPEPVFDPKKEEKDILKNSLFGGLTKVSNTTTTMSKYFSFL